MADSRKFLGKGLTFPFQFSKSGSSKQVFSVSTTDGIEHIKHCVYQLIYTVIGERFMLRSFGTDLSKLVFEPQQETLLTEILAKVTEAIKKWEKRIVVNRLNLTEMNPRDGRIVIAMDFSIINSNVQGNLVFPFYLQSPDQTGNDISGVLGSQN